MARFAHLNANQVVNLNSVALAEWKRPADPQHRSLRLTLAGSSREVEVQEPFASRLWAALDCSPAPTPAAEPDRNGHANGHAREPEPERSRGYNNGDGPEPPRQPRMPRSQAVAPRNGRELFGRVKDAGLVRELTAWGKRQGFPWQMNTWSASEVADAFAEFEALVADARQPQRAERN